MKIYKHDDGETIWLTMDKSFADEFPEFVKAEYEITDEEYKFLKRIEMID